MRLTQPERNSRKQHNLSVRIQRLKRPLMEKRLNTKVVGLDECLHMEGPIRVKELGDMAPEISAAQTSPKSDRFSSEAVLGILSSFPRKAMNTKVGDNFVTHNLDTEFALFRVRT